MEVVILLKDDEETECRTTTLTRLASIERLIKESAKIFNIEPEFQMWFFDNERIDKRSGPLAPIVTGNECELVLKHSMLANWKAFKGHLKRIEKAKPHKAKEFIQMAVEQLKTLEKSKFFLAYPDFSEIWSDFNEKYAHKLDNDEVHIKIAAEKYFLSAFGNNPNNPNVVVHFEEKECRGVQGGFICVVTKIDETDQTTKVTKFHVKTHQFMSSRSSRAAIVDLREIFVYKLLEEINIGPEVYFIANMHKSQYGMYIATKDVDGFEMKSVKKLAPEQMLKLELIEYILMLSDLSQNGNNFGSDEKGNLIIVDFRVCGVIDDSAPKGLKTDEKYANYLKFWNFPTVLDKVNDKIAEQKAFLKARKIDRNASNDLEEYIKKIKEKCDEIVPNPSKKFKPSANANQQ